MKLLKKGGFLGNIGFSLVELIISIAILAVVSTAVGGAMYVSSRSYSRGSSEVAVQEEAQVASNLICDWLIDATSVNPEDGSSDSLVIVHPEGDAKIQITITYNSGTEEVSYSAVDTANPSVEIAHGVLASHVKGINFSSSFKTDRNVRISMDFEVNQRTYHAVTDSTSRNYDFISTGGGSNGDKPVIGFDIPPVGGQYYVVLEPGQNEAHGADFNFIATVYYSDPAQTELEITSSSGDTSMTITRQAGTCNWDVKTQCTDTAMNGATYTFTAKKTLPDGTVLQSDPQSVTVLIRRATKCECSADEAALQTGNQGKAGSTYAPVKIDLGVQNPDVIVPGAAYDSGAYQYKDPRDIKVYCMIWLTNPGIWVNVGNPADSDRYCDYTVTLVDDKPQVQISLRKNLTDKDMYVVVVADHSGILDSVQNDPTDHRAPCATAFNKVTAKTGTNFTYGRDPLHPLVEQAYYDYFIVGKPSGNNLQADGAGFRRGSQAWLVLESDKSNELRNEIMSTVPDYANCNYNIVIRFKAQTPGSSEEMYVFSKYDWNEFIDKVRSGEAIKPRNTMSDIFRLDTAYDIQVQLIAYNKNTHVQTLVESVDTLIPASKPYIADPDNNYIFSTSTYGTWQDAIELNSAHSFYVYYPGFDNEYAYLGQTQNRFHVQEGIDDNNDGKPDRWVDSDTARNEIQNQNAIKNPTSDIPMVVLDDSQHTSYYIGKYDENHYPDVTVNFREIYVSNNNFHSGTYYRICFDDINYETSSYSSGTIGVSEGSVTGRSNQNYNLTGSDYGYIYFKRA